MTQNADARLPMTSTRAEARCAFDACHRSPHDLPPSPLARAGHCPATRSTRSSARTARSPTPTGRRTSPTAASPLTRCTQRTGRAGCRIAVRVASGREPLPGDVVFGVGCLRALRAGARAAAPARHSVSPRSRCMSPEDSEALERLSGGRDAHAEHRQPDAARARVRGLELLPRRRRLPARIAPAGELPVPRAHADPVARPARPRAPPAPPPHQRRTPATRARAAANPAGIKF